MYLKTLEINILDYMNFILLVASAPGTPWTHGQKTKVDLELLIYHALYRYVNPNNKYMKKHMSCI